jgi:iron complex outermembrane recepter protein
MFVRQRRVRAGLLLGSAVLLQSTLSSHAFAQTAEQDAGAASNISAGEEPQAEVVVTGSRIRRSAKDNPAPIAVVTADEIRTVGSQQITDVVNQLPALAITQTNQTSNLAGNAGINALDLRGMGTQRTLVLLDGRRQVPAIPGTSAVDLSNVPSSLVERVEVVTGGASALYGADAVAGVANFILKKDYQGVESNFRYGQSTRDDMRSYGFDLLAGTNFAEGRGNITAFAFYDNQPGSISGQDRPWTAQGYPYYTRAKSGQKYYISDGNYNINSSNAAQVILGGKLYAVNADGSLRAPRLGPSGFTNPTPVDMTNTSEALGTLLTDGGEAQGRYDGWLLSVPSERVSTRVAAQYEFSTAFKLFGNANFSRNTSTAAYSPLSGFGTDVVPADSPYITPAMVTALGGTIPDGGINFGRRVMEVGTPQTQYRRKTIQAVMGAEGDFSLFGKGWNYSAYYSYGRSEQQTRDVNSTAYDRWYLGLDSTTGPDGKPICRSTLTTPGDGCVPINPLVPLTQQMVNYIQYTSDWGKSVMTQQVASAYASGGLFNLPGGALQMVIGAEYRKERNDIGVIPQYDSTSKAYDPTIGTSGVPLIGKYDVKEVYGELHAPLLRDVFAVHSLSLDGAVRLSDYSTAGHTTTWKLGGEWAPIRDIRFRATYGQAVRAPNIGELYTSSSTSGLWITDPCQAWNLKNRVTRTQYTAANCAALKPTDLTNYWTYRDIISKGNLGLKPETARTLTVGAVVEPRFVPGLSLTVDYYNIDLRDAIDSFGAQTLINKCVDQPTLNNVFCGLITRDAGNNIVSVITQKLNLAQYLTRGIDIGLTYAVDLDKFGLGAKSGRVAFDANFTRLLNRRYTLDPTDPGTITEFRGVFGSPTWKGVVRGTYSQPNWGGTWTVRYFSPMKASSTINSTSYERVFTPNFFYHDVFGWVKLNKNIELSGGLNNLFDTAPPRIPGAEAGGANFELSYQSGVYDTIGRTFFVGLRFTR